VSKAKAKTIIDGDRDLSGMLKNFWDLLKISLSRKSISNAGKYMRWGVNLFVSSGAIFRNFMWDFMWEFHPKSAKNLVFIQNLLNQN